jgi:phage baseplate assembly protein W
MDPAALEVGGNQLLAQALVRRLITPRGHLIDDLNYGYDLHRFLGDDLSAAAIAQIQSDIQQELLKDERVVSVTPIVTYSPVTQILTVVVTVVGAGGPFQFTLAVGSVTPTLLQVV